MRKIFTSLMVLGILFLMEGKITEAAAPATTVFGDSNTAGSNWPEYGYDDNKKWSVLLGKSRTVVNKGIGGNTTGMGLNRMNDILQSKPKTVTIMFGTNDAVLNSKFIPKTSLRQYESNLNKMVDTFQSKRINVVLMTTLPIIEQPYYKRHNKNLYLKYGGVRAFHDKYNEVTRKVAGQQRVPLMDTYKTFLRFSGEATDTALIESGLIDPSGNHMTPYGAKVFHNNLANVLSKNKY
ncbi:SGNH/GDSL hydrolase family protein [Planococcus chinensis]|uniref:SGNH/GDSL hydrolase family protein n=1 Tax=Planococcus chinensis TaxID=272917 RepID=A0ABW4QL42_9BACL